MIKFSNNQTSLFDFVNEPIYKRINDPELDRIQKTLESSDLMEEFRKIIYEDKEIRTDFGRPTRPMDVIIKLLILRRLYHWGFRETEIMGNDRISVRKFLGLKEESSPDHTVLSRWNKRIPESLWKKLNDKIIEYAKAKKVTSGKKMRMDTTVVEGNIHHPMDSGLLEDSVKKLGQLAKKAKNLGLASGERVRDFGRSAKKQVLRIVKYAGKRREEQIELFKTHYQQLVQITKHAVHHAKEIQGYISQGVINQEEKRVKKVNRLKASYEKYIPRIEQVIGQTVRRVFKGEAVPVNEKLLSIHEEHLYPVRKGKKTKPTEFGQICKIQESDGGMITEWATYTSQPSDTHLFIPSIDKHIEIFDRPPQVAAGDRGCWSDINEVIAKGKGVKRVCIPKRGRKSRERILFEKQRWFKKAQRFRTGSEATISVLKRRYGMARCMDRGQEGMDSWISLSCIARNLWTIAHGMT